MPISVKPVMNLADVLSARKEMKDPMKKELPVSIVFPTV